MPRKQTLESLFDESFGRVGRSRQQIAAGSDETLERQLVRLAREDMREAMARDDHVRERARHREAAIVDGVVEHDRKDVGRPSKSRAMRPSLLHVTMR